jgi:hypothetical protein
MVKLCTGRCKLVIDLVLMLWICWLVVNTSLFLTTNNNTENIYWDCYGKIPSCLNMSTRIPAARYCHSPNYPLLNLKNNVVKW